MQRELRVTLYIVYSCYFFVAFFILESLESWLTLHFKTYLFRLLFSTSGTVQRTFENAVRILDLLSCVQSTIVRRPYYPSG